MGKYDTLKIIKLIRARKPHVCFKCGEEIAPGENYYKEHINDKFIHTLNLKKYCKLCYERYGGQLL